MLGVVLDPPCFQHHSGVIDAPELGGVQALVAQPVVERFAVAVLPGFSGLDMVGRGSLAFEPFGQLEGDELRAVVRISSGTPCRRIA